MTISFIISTKNIGAKNKKRMNISDFENTCKDLQSNELSTRNNAESILMKLRQINSPYNFCKDILGKILCIYLLQNSHSLKT